MTGRDAASLLPGNAVRRFVDSAGGDAQDGFSLRLNNRDGFEGAVVSETASEPPAARPFGPGLGDAQLDALLGAVDGLYKIEGVRAEPGRLIFYFARPVPWPLFALLELARPFQPVAAAWTRRVGTRAVRAFGLGAGVMDVELI